MHAGWPGAGKSREPDCRAWGAKHLERGWAGQRKKQVAMASWPASPGWTCSHRDTKCDVAHLGNGRSRIFAAREVYRSVITIAGLDHARPQVDEYDAFA